MTQNISCFQRNGPEDDVLCIHLDTPEQSSCREPGETSSSSVTRVQINALVSGDLLQWRFGPDLFERLNQTWSSSGQRLHSIHVEIVQTPITCPRCGDQALYRLERRGFLQLNVYPLFGVYPWNCISCRQPTFLRLRSPQAAPDRLRAEVPQQPERAKAA